MKKSLVTLRDPLRAEAFKKWFTKEKLSHLYLLQIAFGKTFLALGVTAVLCRGNEIDWCTLRCESPPLLAYEFHPSKFLIPCYTRDNGGKM